MLSDNETNIAMIWDIKEKGSNVDHSTTTFKADYWFPMDRGNSECDMATRESLLLLVLEGLSAKGLITGKIIV